MGSGESNVSGTMSVLFPKTENVNNNNKKNAVSPPPLLSHPLYILD